jgi:hypothetical protein
VAIVATGTLRVKTEAAWWPGSAEIRMLATILQSWEFSLSKVFFAR